MVLSSTEVQAIVERACARSEVLDACARRDLGAVITALGAAGLTQDRISALTGIPPGRLSEYAAGRRIPTASSTLEAFADGLALPARARHALGLAAGSPAAASATRSGGAHRGNDSASRAANTKEKRLRAGRGRFLVPAGIIGVLEIIMLLVTVPRPVATPNTEKALNSSNSSAARSVPGSLTIVKKPFERVRYHSKRVESPLRPVSVPEPVSFPTASAPSPPAPVSTPGSSGSGGGTITAGNSKAHCVTLGFAGGVLNQSMITAAARATGVTYNCLDTFSSHMPAWSDWETPWMFRTKSDGWDAWLASSPAHQVVLGMDLIPQSASDNSDPLTWEQSCAAGSYNQNATALAQNLVSYGAGSIVIRLGVEANGNWEADYVGSTTAEMNDWAKCYDNEVTAMRAVPGAHFLFVWNPNICVANLPLKEWYPGDSDVDIIGADAYDEDCSTSKTVAQEGWAAYSTDSHTNTPNDRNFPSLANIEAFAMANGKPMSFPEWGLDNGEPDDAAYITGMAQMFNRDDFSFETYFDADDDGIVPLGSAIPNATAAYSQAFR